MSADPIVYTDTGEKAESHTREDTYEAEQTTAEARDWLRERQNEIRETLQKIAHDYGERSKAAVSAKLFNYEKALVAASNSLEEDGEEQASGLISSVAGQLNTSASKLENSTPAELYAAAEDQARRSPWFALAAAACVGIALSRFVAPDREEEEEYSSDAL